MNAKEERLDCRSDQLFKTPHENTHTKKRLSKLVNQLVDLTVLSHNLAQISNVLGKKAFRRHVKVISEGDTAGKQQAVVLSKKIPK